MAELNGNGFVFLDAVSRAYNIRMLDGQPWLCFWHEGYKCFTTLRKATEYEVDRYKQLALPKDMADLYFKSNGGPQ